MRRRRRGVFDLSQPKIGSEVKSNMIEQSNQIDLKSNQKEETKIGEE